MRISLPRSIFVINDETAREQFLIRKRREKTIRKNADTKRKKAIEKRISGLSKLIQKVYEDRVLGNMPNKVCAELLENYQQGRENLQTKLNGIIHRSDAKKHDKADVDEFISRLKKYASVEELTREMCLDFLEYVTISKCVDKNTPREISHLLQADR